NTVVIFRRNENIAVVMPDLLLPPHAFRVLGWHPGVGGDLVEERQRMVAKVDELELHVGSLLGDVEEPLPSLVAKAGGARCGKDDGDLGLAHCQVLSERG